MDCFTAYLEFCKERKFECGKMTRDYLFWSQAWSVVMKQHELR